ncbi:MAG TPA: hypothetical protein PLB92_16100, partial [Rhodoglobus sp.]|nr:hypothetical protein [Rhodoglobus sp.]
LEPGVAPGARARAAPEDAAFEKALRGHLLARGHRVFTSPAMNARGPVVDQLVGFGPFGGMPIVLPEHLTVNSTGDIDLAGEHLARFLTYLHTDHGVDTLDIVAHSMGGLFSRSAIRLLQLMQSPLRVRSLTTLGTPWQGSVVGDFTNGDVDLSAAVDDAFLERVLNEFQVRAASLPVGAASR